MKIKDCVLIEAFKCNQEETIVDVAKKLRKITLRHIFVTNEQDEPQGIISIVDINNRVVAENKNPQELKAKDIMSQPIEIVNLEEDIETFYNKITETNHVMWPVTENNKMIGIITIHQLMKHIK